MALDSIVHWYLLVGAVLAVLQVAITWPIHPKAPAFFYTLGVACMLILWPLFLFALVEEAAAHRENSVDADTEGLL